MSRNILNDEASQLVPFESAANDKNILVDFQLAADTRRAERYDTDDPTVEDRKQEVLLKNDVLKGNDSVTEGNGAESVGVDLSSPPGGGAVADVDAAKPAHADEM